MRQLPEIKEPRLASLNKGGGRRSLTEDSKQRILNGVASRYVNIFLTHISLATSYLNLSKAALASGTTLFVLLAIINSPPRKFN